MIETQYLQQFKEEWVCVILFIDWLLKIDNDSSKAWYKFCKNEINAKGCTTLKFQNHKKVSEAISTSRFITSFVKRTSMKSSMAEGRLALFIVTHCSILIWDHLNVLCVKQFKLEKGIKILRTKCTTVFCHHILKKVFLTIYTAISSMNQLT